MLSKFTKNLGEEHWIAIKKVMIYIKGTMHYALHFTSYPTMIEAYLDTSWREEKDRTSIGGFVFLLCESAISWKSKKQSVIS